MTNWKRIFATLKRINLCRLGSWVIASLKLLLLWDVLIQQWSWPAKSFGSLMDGSCKRFKNGLRNTATSWRCWLCLQILQITVQSSICVMCWTNKSSPHYLHHLKDLLQMPWCICNFFPSSCNDYNLIKAFVLTLLQVAILKKTQSTSHAAISLDVNLNKSYSKGIFMTSQPWKQFLYFYYGCHSGGMYCYW